MIIVKVKHETGPDPEFLDITVSDNRLHLLFLLNMLEKNERVIQYEIMRSTMTSFNVVTDVKNEFNFYQPHFTNLRQ